MVVKMSIKEPEHIIIEQTAGELAATWYEIGRSNGMRSKYKTARKYAEANLEKFVPKAIDILTDMLANPSTPQTMKDHIMDALLERANAPELSIFNKTYDFVEKKVGPIVIESPKVAKIFSDVARGK
jgi:hypothetical protein